MSATYTNRFGIQMGEDVRLIFRDERPGMPNTMGEPGGQVQSTLAAEVVMSLTNARALRDMLNQNLKDPEKMQ